MRLLPRVGAPRVPLGTDSRAPLLPEKNNHTVVLRPKITSDIKAREPCILGRREEGGEAPGICKF